MEKNIKSTIQNQLVESTIQNIKNVSYNVYTYSREQIVFHNLHNLSYTSNQYTFTSTLLLLDYIQRKIRIHNKYYLFKATLKSLQK